MPLVEAGYRKDRNRHYGRRWETLRNRFIAHNPLCTFCADGGEIVPAEVVDHITPHRGDPFLLYDWGNLQSLCFTCHNGRKKSDEMALDRGEDRSKPSCDEDGYPIDGDW